MITAAHGASRAVVILSAPAKVSTVHGQAMARPRTISICYCLVRAVLSSGDGTAALGCVEVFGDCSGAVPPKAAS